jgi:predicted RNase H-like HicB family nuclease
MIYPIVIHKDKDSDYGVTVPDLPGCFSAGTSLDDALNMAKEAIELHLEGLIEEGSVPPTPRTIESHQKNPDCRGGTWALVNVDSTILRIHAKRVNVTIPQRVLDAVDRTAAAQNDTRSGLLTKAATTYLQTHRTVAAEPRRSAKWSAAPRRKNSKK